METLACVFVCIFRHASISSIQGPGISTSCSAQRSRTEISTRELELIKSSCAQCPTGPLAHTQAKHLRMNPAVCPGEHGGHAQPTPPRLVPKFGTDKRKKTGNSWSLIVGHCYMMVSPSSHHHDQLTFTFHAAQLHLKRRDHCYNGDTQNQRNARTHDKNKGTTQLHRISTKRRQTRTGHVRKEKERASDKVKAKG